MPTKGKVDEKAKKVAAEAAAVAAAAVTTPHVVPAPPAPAATRFGLSTACRDGRSRPRGGRARSTGRPPGRRGERGPQRGRALRD
jgi:hypothetical protein